MPEDQTDEQMEQVLEGDEPEEVLEARGELYLVPGSNASSLPDSVVDELMRTATNPPTPQPAGEAPGVWDAGFHVEGSQFIVEGSAGPSGYGTATVKVPLGDMNENHAPYVIPVEASMREISGNVKDQISQAGWSLQPNHPAV